MSPDEKTKRIQDKLKELNKELLSRNSISEKTKKRMSSKEEFIKLAKEVHKIIKEERGQQSSHL